MTQPTWSVLAPSGSCAELVRNLLDSNHVSHTDEAHEGNNLIVITSGLDDYAWIMLGHWQMFTRDYPDQYKAWVDTHYCGHGYPATPEDMTAEDWAQHVVASYGHIGKFAPLNNTLEDLTRSVANPGRIYELALDRLVQEPEAVLADLSKWCATPWAEASRTQFLTHLAQYCELRRGWTQQVQVLRPETHNF
jgi:hypothetical protein